MALVPFWRWQNSAGSGQPGAFGCYFKLGTTPSANTTLMDLDGAGNGYFRCYITSGMIVKMDLAFTSITETITCNSTALSTGVWYWVTCYGITYGDRWDGQHGLALYTRNGVSVASNAGATRNMGSEGSTTPPCSYRVGLGVSLTSGYDNFPNNSNYKMAKAIVQTQSGAIGAPAVDPSGTATWSGRQTAGSAATLTANTSSYNAAAGPQGLTINTDGPFA